MRVAVRAEAVALAGRDDTCGLALSRGGPWGLIGLYETYMMCICFVWSSMMGVVKISDRVHENLGVAGRALGWPIHGHAGRRMRVGTVTEMHPEMDRRERALDIGLAVTAQCGEPRASSAGQH